MRSLPIHRGGKSRVEHWRQTWAAFTELYNGEEFGVMCTREFNRRCHITIDCNEEPRPLEVCYTYNKPEIQEHDLIYMSHLLRRGYELLAELYCDNPPLLRQRAKDFHYLQQNRPRDDDSFEDCTPQTLDQLAAIEAKILRTFTGRTLLGIQQIHRSGLMQQTFHDDIFPTFDLECAGSWLCEVYRIFCEQLDVNGVYRWCLENGVDFLSIEPPARNFQFWCPTIRGLAETLSATIRQYLLRMQSHMLELSLPVSIRSPVEETQLLVPSQFHTDRVTVLFAVAGSGKTKAISNLLRRELGYYVMAGNINPRGQTSPYEARRSEAHEFIQPSKDTWTLRNMMDHKMPPWDSEALEDGDLLGTYVFGIIATARRIILNTFRNLLARESDIDERSVAERWFRFQTNCGQVDAFDAVFKLLAFTPNPLIFHRSNDLKPYCAHDFRHHNANFQHDTTGDVYAVQHVCIDEAQADMAVVIKGIKSPINLLSGLIHFWPGKEFVTISGTSLNLQSAVATVENEGMPFVVLPAKTANVLSKLPLVETHADFHALLQQRSPELNTVFKSFQLMASVLRESSRLHGRYRWSTMFIQQLERLSGQGELSESSVAQAAKHVYHKAKHELKMQLQKINHKGDKSSYKLIHDILPNAAIWSDLLDQPYIFPTHEALCFVEQGFAAVETQPDSQLKAKLVERIAVDAIIEGLGESDTDMIGEKLLETLNSVQDDASGFGTKAERLLVWELRKCLQLRHSGNLLGFVEHRRTSIINEFGMAKNTSGENLGSKLDLSTYFLLQGHGTSHKPATGIANTMQPWNWLESIRRTGKPEYSFILPDENVGPDLMMVLKKRDSQSPSDFVLCFVQLKTGGKKISGDELIKALHTITQNGFYIARKPQKQRYHIREPIIDASTIKPSLMDRKECLDIELGTKFWSEAKKSSIYFTAAQEAQNCSPNRRHDEYFVWMDKNQTAAMFGKKYAQLLSEVKNRDIPIGDHDS